MCTAARTALGSCEMSILPSSLLPSLVAPGLLSLEALRDLMFLRAEKGRLPRRGGGVCGAGVQSKRVSKSHQVECGDYQRAHSLALYQRIPPLHLLKLLFPQGKFLFVSE